MRSSLKKLVSIVLAVVCIFTFTSEVFASKEYKLRLNKTGTNYVTIKADNSSDWLPDSYEVRIDGLVSEVTKVKCKNCTVKIKRDESTGTYRVIIKDVKGLSFGKVLLKVVTQNNDTDVKTSDKEVSLWRGNCY